MVEANEYGSKQAKSWCFGMSEMFLRFSVLGHFLSILDKAAHSCRYGSSVELTDRVNAWHGCLCVTFDHLPALPKDSNEYFMLSEDY